MEGPTTNPPPILTYAVPGVEPVRGVAVERFDQGMRVVIAPGSAWKAVPVLLLSASGWALLGPPVIKYVNELVRPHGDAAEALTWIAIAAILI